MELLKTQDYLLLIDEEAEIKENDIVYGKNIQKVMIFKYPSNSHFYSKIIAYRKLNSEAKELDLPLLSNPFKTYRVGRKQKRAILDEKGVEIGIFKTGSEEQAQKYCDYLNNKQFSLEDIKKAIVMAREDDKTNTGFYANTVEEIIQSLSIQQLPKEFIPEYDIVHTDHAPNGFERLLKFKTNSEGKKEIQGTYKY